MVIFYHLNLYLFLQYLTYIKDIIERPYTERLKLNS